MASVDSFLEAVSVTSSRVVATYRYDVVLPDGTKLEPVRHGVIFDFREAKAEVENGEVKLSGTFQPQSSLMLMIEGVAVTVNFAETTESFLVPDLFDQELNGALSVEVESVDVDGTDFYTLLSFMTPDRTTSKSISDAQIVGPTLPTLPDDVEAMLRGVLV